MKTTACKRRRKYKFDFMSKKLDEKDIEILSCLKANSRLSASAISQKIGMSVSTVTDRIKKLETTGVIKQYTLMLDPGAVGLDVSAFIEINMTDKNYVGARSGIRKFVESHPEVVECHAVTGTSAFIFKINTHSMVDLERIIGEIQTCDGAVQTKTSIVLQTIKQETFADLK